MRLVTTSEDAKYIKAQGRLQENEGKVDKKCSASQKELKLPAPAYQNSPSHGLRPYKCRVPSSPV
jgi:hypothetical protein